MKMIAAPRRTSTALWTGSPLSKPHFLRAEVKYSSRPLFTDGNINATPRAASTATKATRATTTPTYPQPGTDIGDLPVMFPEIDAPSGAVAKPVSNAYASPTPRGIVIPQFVKSPARRRANA